MICLCNAMAVMICFVFEITEEKKKDSINKHLVSDN